MREIVVSEFTTLDGVMEAPGGEPSHPHTDWVGAHRSPPELFAFKAAEVDEAGALLLGRTTYESFAGAWPGYEGPMAERMNALPKYVLTSRPGLTWNATAVDGLEAIAALKKDGADGPLLVNGSATLVRALLAAGLVDELRLQVFPVAIGGGLRFWPEDRSKLALRLTDTTHYGDVVGLTYRA